MQTWIALGVVAALAAVARGAEAPGIEGVRAVLGCRFSQLLAMDSLAAALGAGHHDM